VFLLALGWLPLFIAEAIRNASPDLDARYVPQYDALQWIRVTDWCSLLAVATGVIWAVRVLFRRFWTAEKVELNR
jgi:hypothetical protein